jgi:hypothetical protein
MGFKTINGRKVFIDDNRRTKSNGRNDKSEGMVIGNGTKIPKEPEVIKIPALEDSRSKMEELLKNSKYNDNEAERDSYREGFDRGITFAEISFDEIDKVKIGTDITKLDFGADEFDTGFEVITSREGVEEFITQSAFSSEENDRQFSPFEQTAKELNERETDEDGNPKSDAFDAFQDGIGDAINYYVSFVFEKNKDLGT